MFLKALSKHFISLAFRVIYVDFAQSSLRGPVEAHKIVSVSDVAIFSLICLG